MGKGKLLIVVLMAVLLLVAILGSRVPPGQAVLTGCAPGEACPKYERNNWWWYFPG